ncbi:MAG TPA: hypothetical protein PKY59_02635 [Pyrinomonadaceae bacterium]|nr:hypothetical protein [Pyrinomonadaceae bacterium]
MNNTKSATEKHGYFRVKVYRGTCFGSPALTVEIKFEISGKTSCEFTEGFEKKNALIERTEAEIFLKQIFEIIEKEEVLTDLQSANVRHHAELEWADLPFVKTENTGKFEAFSNEWFIEQIEEFIEYEAETLEKRERFQKILDKKPHRRALEIYKAVNDFRRKYLK